MYGVLITAVGDGSDPGGRNCRRRGGVQSPNLDKGGSATNIVYLMERQRRAMENDTDLQ